jgi:hypothetical protein
MQAPIPSTSSGAEASGSPGRVFYPDHKLSTEQWVNPPNPDMDLVSFGLRVVFHHGAAYQMDNASAFPRPRFEILSFRNSDGGA